MALVVADLISPQGMLEADLFDAADPGGDTETRAAAWLALGEAETSSVLAGRRDEATKWYVYYRAWSAKADRLAAQLSSADLTGLSYTIAKGQYDHFERRAKEALAAYENVLESSSDEPTGGAAGVSASVQHRIRW